MDPCFVFALLGAVWLAAFAVYFAGGYNRIYLRIEKLLKFGIMEEKEFNKMILKNSGAMATITKYKFARWGFSA